MHFISSRCTLAESARNHRRSATLLFLEEAAAPDPVEGMLERLATSATKVTRVIQDCSLDLGLTDDAAPHQELSRHLSAGAVVLGAVLWAATCARQYMRQYRLRSSKVRLRVL